MNKVIETKIIVVVYYCSGRNMIIAYVHTYVHMYALRCYAVDKYGEAQRRNHFFALTLPKVEVKLRLQP